MLGLPVPWWIVHQYCKSSKKRPQQGIGVVLARPVGVTATVAVLVAVAGVEVEVAVPPPCLQILYVCDIVKYSRQPLTSRTVEKIR